MCDTPAVVHVAVRSRSLQFVSVALLATLHVIQGSAFAQNPLAPQWRQADVGDVGIEGSASVSFDGDLRINGAGSDIWGTADSFHFVYQPIEDGRISANPPSLQNTNPFAKIGVMLRASLDPGSPEVTLDVKPDGTVELLSRSVQGGETTFVGGLNHGGGLTLVRSNGAVTATVCTDSCVIVGSTPFPSGPALIGAIVTSHDPTVLNHGMFPASTPTVWTVPDPWTTGDVGDVGVAGSSLFQNGTFTVSGAGADIWGTADAYRTVATDLQADGSISARVVSENGANEFAKAGVIANSNGGSGPTVILDIRPDGAVEFMSRATQGGQMAFIAGAASPFPAWLKLQRSGNTFSGYVSADGDAWQLVGSTDVLVATHVLVGLAVTSHDTSALNTAIFDHASVSSAAPIDTDIGDVGATGAVAFANGITQISGAGADIWGSQDAFNYYYSSLINDGAMYARVTALDNTSPYAKAGIMIRASTDPAAAHVILDVKPDGGIELMARTTAGGSTTYLAGTARSFPVMFYMVRTGATITGYVIDGTQMTPVGSVTVDLPSDALIGAAVTSHVRGTPATATFDFLQR